MNQTPLFVATEWNRADVAELLMAKGADVNVIDTRLLTCLYLAAQRGNVDLLKGLLAHGANIAPNGGRSAFYEAINHADIVKALLDAGPDKEAKNFALIWAAQRGNAAVVKLLLDAGADKEAKDTESFYVSVNSVPAAPVHATPLIHAVAASNSAIVKLLLEAGADIDARDTFGQTASMWASRRHNKYITELLDKARLTR